MHIIFSAVHPLEFLVHQFVHRIYFKELKYSHQRASLQLVAYQSTAAISIVNYFLQVNVRIKIAYPASVLVV